MSLKMYFVFFAASIVSISELSLGMPNYESAKYPIVSFHDLVKRSFPNEMLEQDENDDTHAAFSRENFTLPSLETYPCLLRIGRPIECQLKVARHWEMEGIINPDRARIGCCMIWNSFYCALDKAEKVCSERDQALVKKFIMDNKNNIISMTEKMGNEYSSFMNGCNDYPEGSPKCDMDKADREVNYSGLNSWSLTETPAFEHEVEADASDNVINTINRGIDKGKDDFVRRFKSMLKNGLKLRMEGQWTVYADQD